MTRTQMIEEAVRRQKLSRRYMISIIRRADTAQEYMAGTYNRPLPPPGSSYSVTRGGRNFYVGSFSYRPYCVDDWPGKSVAEIAFSAPVRSGTLNRIRKEFRRLAAA